MVRDRPEAVIAVVDATGEGLAHKSPTPLTAAHPPGKTNFLYFMQPARNIDIIFRPPARPA